MLVLYLRTYFYQPFSKVYGEMLRNLFETKVIIFILLGQGIIMHSNALQNLRNLVCSLMRFVVREPEACSDLTEWQSLIWLIFALNCLFSSSLSNLRCQNILKNTGNDRCHHGRLHICRKSELLGYCRLSVHLVRTKGKNDTLLHFSCGLDPVRTKFLETNQEE